MKNLKKLVLLLAVFAMTMSTFAGDVLIGKIPYDMNHAYHQSACRTFEDYAKEKYGADVIIIDGEGANEKQLAAVETMIARGVDGIALHTGDAGLMTTAIELAHSADIPIVSTLIRPTKQIAPHIQPSEQPSSFKMGEIAAKKWLEANPDKSCKVAMLNFGGIEQITEMRTGAFFDGVKSVDPDAEMVTMLNGEGSTVKSMGVTLDILQSRPDVNIIFGANDEMALGALAACEQLGRGKMDNGKPLTEIIAGLDGSQAAVFKIYDPSSSFKMTHGAVKEVAQGEVDTLIGIVNGDIAYDKYSETPVPSLIVDYYYTPISDAQKFLEENFYYTGSIKDEIK